MNEYPLVSIMIATYNSQRILQRPLDAIRKQSYPQDKIEILIIDGGSTDGTLEIAKEYDCIVLNNPKTDPVNAKIIGMNNATGKYLVTIDHDEVLTNPDSIKIRVEAMLKNPECKVAFCSGYKCPQGYSGVNEYISEFGDPFSLFYYRFSKGYRFYKRALDKRATQISENEHYYVYSFDKPLDRVIVEIVCFATMIQLDYFRGLINPEREADEFVHLFYMMVAKGDNKAILSKNDPLEHYSVDSLRKYLPKIKWRIINNIHYSDKAVQGFTGREDHTKSTGIRKYFFLIYSLSAIFPCLDGAYLSITRGNVFFLLHPLLCIYVSFYILVQFFLKAIGHKPALKNYDGSNS